MKTCPKCGGSGGDDLGEADPIRKIKPCLICEGLGEIPDVVAEGTAKFGWVIEHADSEPSMPRYFTGDYWSEPGDSLNAIRFSRELDASRYMQMMDPPQVHRVAEHGWISKEVMPDQRDRQTSSLRNDEPQSNPTAKASEKTILDVFYEAKTAFKCDRFHSESERVYAGLLAVKAHIKSQQADKLKSLRTQYTEFQEITKHELASRDARIEEFRIAGQGLLEWAREIMANDKTPTFDAPGVMEEVLDAYAELKGKGEL